MVVALTEGQWLALCKVTGTKDVFTALETALNADLTKESERYRLRDTIAAILKPWFAARDLEQVADELTAARVLWGRYQGMTDVVASHRSHRHAVLADMTLPGSAEQSITARSPLRWNGEYGEAGAPPALGRESEQVLTEWLGLSSAEIGGLRKRGVIGTAERR